MTIPLNVQERVQLDSMDLVICLATNFGAIQEAEEFGREQAPFFLLWMSDRAKGKYSDNALVESLRLLGTPTIFFNGSDLASCIIATGSTDWVERWRAQKWAIDSQRQQLDRIDPKRGRHHEPR